MSDTVHGPAPTVNKSACTRDITAAARRIRSGIPSLALASIEQITNDQVFRNKFLEWALSRIDWNAIPTTDNVPTNESLAE